MDTKLVKSLSFNKKVDKSNAKNIFTRLGSPFSTRSTPVTPVEESPQQHEHNDYLPPDSSTKTASSEEKQLLNDLKHIRTALDYFLNSNINEAETILKPHYKESMYYSLGYSFILYLKCVMTFQQDDIDTALDVLKHTIQLANNQRKKEGGWLNSVTSWVKGTTLEDIKNMNIVERHAELVYAEAYLLKALLSILRDESVMSFLRESLNIRSSYSTYIALQRYVEYTKNNNSTVVLDSDFTSGVALGIGCFSIILSMLPTSVVKVAEFIGFTSNRVEGLQILESVGGWGAADDDDTTMDNKGLRRQLCDMVLMAYHILLSKLIPLSDVDIPFAERILKNSLKLYPHGVFFLYFNGRLMVGKRKLDEAEEQYQLAIDTQKEWKQLQHMCFWELGLIYLMKHEWQKAYDLYSILQRDSNWSKAVYSYLRAISLYMMANEINDKVKKTSCLEQVTKYMNQVTGEKQKIAGKSIPIEKFVARKARKFTSQNNYLLLPDLEILNAFAAFDFIPMDILQRNRKRIMNELDHLTNNQDKIMNYYDDLCLAQYLHAITCRQLYELKESDMNTIHTLHESSLQSVFDHADKITLDHYIYYFSRYEHACMFMLDKDYTKAESEIQVILKANDRGQYSVGSGPHAKNKYSLASALVLKCHNLMTKIKYESKN
ncbi:uncharacterized protein BX663DRAFT_510263 [Cokeromyces recurvatus]|uniref:uncharacterized protein n=1 Tax=Cokeromyces recurvatus TaxID=90255 RepID=UPI00221F8EAD|nr:uncharacterized protein BX663DRAFT_510263 [Cokeromyces recurvatus]KAI7902725.1 hypothetical protein BX663DRAFT_510263 [Cokeromyces recurvatus]